MENSPGQDPVLFANSLSLRHPHPWPLGLGNFQELERESDPSLRVRNADFVWPQGKVGQDCRGLWLVRPGQGWGWEPDPGWPFRMEWPGLVTQPSGLQALSCRTGQ